MSTSSGPNLILVMTDQQQARACGRENFALDTTPHLDRLAGSGAWFHRAYTAAPVCLPARVSTLTGRFPSAHRCQANPHAGDCCATADLPGWLREHGGYRTALVGKNHSHLGRDDFDHFFALGHNGAPAAESTRDETEAALDRYLGGLRHGVATEPAPFPPEATPPARAVTEACRWIDEAAEAPFFLWLSIPEPHNPYYAPEPYFSLFDPDELPAPHPPVGEAVRGSAFSYLARMERHAIPNFDQVLPRYRANYYGMLRLIDDQIARLTEHLTERGLMDDTVLVFVSDHGDYVGDFGLMRKGAGLSDSLMRIPMVACGAGVAVQGRRPEGVSLVDLFPTFCEAAGLEAPRDVQGRSLWPLLQGRAVPEEEFASVYAEQGYGGAAWGEEDAPSVEELCAQFSGISFHELHGMMQSGHGRMLRCGDWKLVVYENGRAELFNLAEDPAEQHNRIDDPEAGLVRGELGLELARRMTQFAPANPNIPFGSGLKRPPHGWYRAGH